MIKKERKWRKLLKIVEITWWTTITMFFLSLLFIIEYAYIFCIIAGISAIGNLLVWRKYLLIEDDYLHYIREKKLMDLR